MRSDAFEESEQVIPETNPDLTAPQLVESPETEHDSPVAGAPWPRSFDLLLREYLPVLPPSEPIYVSSKLADLGLDSMNMVGLLANVEDSYGFVFPDELLSMDLFDTAGSLWATVDRLR